jgi:mRNA interferase RelE/StbE
MYEILVSHEAEKYYERQDKKTKQRINRCLDAISANPFASLHVKKLHGELAGKCRYSVGKLRIIYEVDFDNQLVKIISIAGRGDVYKR